MRPNKRAIEFFVLTSSESRQEAASLLAVAPDVNVQVALVEDLDDQGAGYFQFSFQPRAGISMFTPESVT